ncbi:DUF7064 domain-containing protein [Nocardia jinanensis]|uniref:Uncharacterized protein n=1 Tax=Nocardia jinanensis TaxID=382504 RepID=A0A917RKM0_9NOCA|nr:hypothetical protein [Nocardia jinanensis]GGL13092.1 hypothetical protein GCM10011588_29390 [Nocardia jinanensis]
MTTTLTTADDNFHPRGDDPWWTETVWFAWMVPERQLLGHYYLSFRSNLGVFAGGVTVFDNTAELPWELPFHSWDWHQPIPGGLDLRRAELDNGMRIVAEEPGQRYHLTYRHRRGLNLDMRYTATHEPLLTDEVPPFNKGHLDQIGRVTGEMVLHGETIPIDCFAMRDRSWGPRREGPQPRAGYTYSALPDGTAFLSVSVSNDHSDEIRTGFLTRDGIQHRLVAGDRKVDRDRDGRPATVRIDAVDEIGRSMAAEGRVISRQVLPVYSSMLCWNSLVEWTVDGQQGWGEDQDVWHPRKWRQFKESSIGSDIA